MKFAFLNHYPDATGLTGQYNHENQPGFHIPYMYNYADKPWKTQCHVRDIMKICYNDSPLGICKNEDVGELSAWYMFSAFGFYPVDPLSGEYIFGAPQLKEATLRLPNGKLLKIKANNLSEENKYVKAIRLNGKKIDYTSIKNDSIKKGEHLSLT